MEYFTGRFQGRIPITTTDRDQAREFEYLQDAEIVATLLNCIYGGDKWTQEHCAADTDRSDYNAYIFRR